jgi:hypothetical protein
MQRTIGYLLKLKVELVEEIYISHNRALSFMRWAEREGRRLSLSWLVGVEFSAVFVVLFEYRTTGPELTEDDPHR